MAYTRDLTPEERRFCEVLGGVIIFWNHVEGAMRALVQRATRIGEGDQRVMVLVTNLGTTALSEALRAIADDHREEIKPHLKHCASVFDAERVYRDYYVHNPLTFETKGESTSGFAKHVTIKGGVLKAHMGQMTVDQLEDFHDRLSALQEYISSLLAHSYGSGLSLSSLQMPPLPRRLEVGRVRVIEDDPALSA